MTVVAMMQCSKKVNSEVPEQGNGERGQVLQPGDVELVAYVDANGEYAEYFKYTPYGSCHLGILNDAALEQFEPGAVYRVTFERVAAS